MLTTRLAPPITPSPLAITPTASSFSSLTPAALDSWLADDKALIVDIRPHAAYSSARLPRAISLSVPSTLLKRPLFSLQRLSEMLPSQTARNRFSAWRAASRILVYDADSHTLADSSNINGLLRKFKADGFHGDLVWLQGGFQAVWKDRRDIVETRPPTPEPADNDDEQDDKSAKILRTRHLPMSAFNLSSTTASNSSPGHSRQQPPNLSSSASAVPHPAINPFFDTIRQNVELSHGITDRIPLRLSRRVRRRISELPFPWLRSVARHAALTLRNASDLSDYSSSSSEEEPNPQDVEQGKEALAMQFYKIELAEQRRLMGIMEHHSKESGQVADKSSSDPRLQFPYSITAGVEKGAKNRYRHIWPFEHARVRLHMNDDDYVNASYVQPLGTNKRYIATQGPLPATFTDFWTLCWEQNVHVIVMLTREVEGAMVKCGTYWADTVFGPLRLRLVSTEGLPISDDRPSTAHPLSHHASRPSPRHLPHSAGSQRRYRHHRDPDSRSETVKRVFELTHISYPEVAPRKIVHLQFLEWPDMNVPDDPRGVLGLIKQVENAVRESRSGDPVSEPPRSKNTSFSINELDKKTGIAKHALGGNNPVLLHCSAGVGRTGGFIAVDAVLDAIRREIRLAADPQQPSRDAMDIDPKPESTSFSRLFSDNRPETVVQAAAPVAMQIDSEPPDTSGSELETSTRLWVQNVQDETDGVVGTSSTVQQSNSDSSFASASSSLEGLRDSNGTHGTFNYSSSSLETSVSGASQYSKVDIPQVPPLPVTPPAFEANRMEVSPLPPRFTKKLSLRSSNGSLNVPVPSSQSPSVDETSAVAPSQKISISIPDKFSSGNEALKTFDYKEPRRLHEDYSPALLSTYEDPIWEVVQDMREQRMSLCQSLRQYVFVHAAIIEGALMVLDEEQEYASGLRPRRTIGEQNRSVSPSPPTGFALHHPLLSSNDTQLSTGKRCASPTELSKEGKGGEAIVSKRPSIKRKERSGEDHLAHEARYHPMPIRPTLNINTGGNTSGSA